MVKELYAWEEGGSNITSSCLNLPFDSQATWECCDISRPRHHTVKAWNRAALYKLLNDTIVSGKIEELGT
jgi:hypothetical protein